MRTEMNVIVIYRESKYGEGKRGMKSSTMGATSMRGKSSLRRRPKSFGRTTMDPREQMNPRGKTCREARCPKGEMNMKQSSLVEKTRFTPTRTRMARVTTNSRPSHRIAMHQTGLRATAHLQGTGRTKDRPRMRPRKTSRIITNRRWSVLLRCLVRTSPASSAATTCSGW